MSRRLFDHHQGEVTVYYAKYNLYGSDTSVGFADTWQVVSFDARAARDAWVAQRRDRRDVEAITRTEALRIAGRAQRRQHREGGYLADLHLITDDGRTFVRAF
jgi:hypothetical protein